MKDIWHGFMLGAVVTMFLAVFSIAHLATKTRVPETKSRPSLQVGDSLFSVRWKAESNSPVLTWFNIRCNGTNWQDAANITLECHSEPIVLPPTNGVWVITFMVSR